MCHLNIRIYGQVHGVFFRAAAQDKARELGLVGSAANKSDGSVYVEAEGEEEPLRKFAAWCRQGPPLAKVERVETEPGQPKNFTEFRIS